MEEKKEIELLEQYIVIAIPKDTVEVEIKAKVWHDKEVREVSKTMDFGEVRAAFKEAEDGYIPSDAVFTLTDIGKEMLGKMKAEQLHRMGVDEEE